MLYYTGANNTGEDQKDPSLSLGGKISGSVIPNGKLGTLFNIFNQKDIDEERTDCRCIAFKNFKNSEIELSIKAFGGDYSDLLIGIQEPYEEKEELYFEKIEDGRSIPYTVMFEDFSENPGLIKIPAMGWVGLWIKKQLKDVEDENKSLLLSTKDTISCEDAEKLLKAREKLSEEDLLTLELEII